MSNKYTTIRTLKDTEILKKFLDKYPKAKDNDELLIGIVWKHELESNGFNSTNLDLKDFLILLSNQDISKPKTITRLRRKIQEEFPEYRGEKYAKRHANVSEAQSDLGYSSSSLPKSIKNVTSKSKSGYKSSKIII